VRSCSPGEQRSFGESSSEERRVSQNSHEAFYDGLWGREPQALNRHERDRFAAVFSLLRGLRRPNARILEAGCGTGKLASRLQAFGEVTALDWSEVGLEAGRRLAPGVDFRRLDLVRGDLSSVVGRFGLTVSSEVLEHVGRGNREAFAGRLASTLVPGGVLIITTPNRARIEALADIGALYQPEEDLLSPSEVLALVRRAGLSVAAERSATFLERPWERSAMFRRARRMLRRSAEGQDVVDWLLSRTRLGLYFVVCARKP
jgi:2-polyprenyl-3-methyl-5-hydroxy-6-metoxy-1,4-benzoquinol methylase